MMFKRLRTKIAEEAQRFPIQDLIDLNSSTGSPVLQPENEQFSINDEDDSNASELSSPCRAQENTAIGREESYLSTPPTLIVACPEATDPVLIGAENSSLKIGMQDYIAQTDTESEREEFHPSDLEGVSKEQLTFALQKLKRRTQKYKTHYTKAIAAFKEVLSEKEKLQHALSDAQDKTLRRLAELREQCQLEQQAKAHLEQNLQMMLDEKDQMIYVLETKVHLLKEGTCSNKHEATQSGNLDFTIDLEDKKTLKENDVKDDTEEIQALKEKIKRQEALLAKCKETIKSNKERTSQLIDEKNSLLEQLDKKNEEKETFQVHEPEMQPDLQTELQRMKEKLNELEKQQEENSMAMAETKRNMHEELELREQQLCKLKSELQNAQHEKEVLQKKVEERDSKYLDLQNKHEEKISALQCQLETTESNMEKERENLMHELSRGKAAALSLVKEEYGRKINVIEEECKAKLEELKHQHEIALKEKDTEIQKTLKCQEEQFKNIMNKKNEEMNLSIAELSLPKTTAASEVAIQTDELQTEREELEIDGLNSQLQETLLVNAGNHSSSSEELDNYKCQTAELYRMLDQLELEKTEEVSELKQKLEALQYDNHKLSTHIKELGELQQENEELNSRLKQIKDSHDKNNELNKMILALQEEIGRIKQNLLAMECDNEKLTSHVKELGSVQEETEVLSDKLKQMEDSCNKNSELNKTMLVLEEEIKGLKQNLEAVQCDNDKLTNRIKELGDLQQEKEELSFKLKQMEDSYNTNNELNKVILVLEDEIKKMKEECSIISEIRKENEQLKVKLDETERSKKEVKCVLEEEFTQLKSEKLNLEEELRKTKYRMELLNQQLIPRESNDEANSLLKEEIVFLKEQLHLLETQTFGISHVDNYQNHLATVKSDYEERLKEKDIELNSKLKQIIRDFATQMDQKETEYKETLSNFIEKGQEIEGRMERKHREDMAALEQELYEKSCALEDVAEHYQQLFSEKENELQNYKEKVKEDNTSVDSGGINESSQDMLQTEANDWEDGWMDAEDTTSIPQTAVKAETDYQENSYCAGHLEQIKNLESSLASSREEIAELRFLLGLTNRSVSSTDTNHTNEISLKLPEPTEFEYLRNILYEYMMGKEPMILARVIAAVLKFTEEQTHEILQKESIRQTLKNHWMSS